MYDNPYRETYTMSDSIFSLVSAIVKGHRPAFVSFTYRAKESNELAKHVIILGAKTENLYKRDLEVLAVMLENLSGLALQAATELAASRHESLTVGIGNNSQYTLAGQYQYVEGFDGVQFHTDAEGTHVYVNGLSHSKTVIEEGTYKVVKSRPLTIEKNKIRKELPSSRFRTFRLDSVKSARINGDTLELE